jgi:hypothetical protein
MWKGGDDLGIEDSHLALVLITRKDKYNYKHDQQ